MNKPTQAQPIPRNSKLPSRLLAGIYLLVGIVILIGSGSIQASSTVQNLLGIAAEFTLAIVAILFLKLEKLPVRETLRFRPVDLRIAVLALLTIPGVWFISIVINLVLSLLFGYTAAVPPSYFPDNWLDYILFSFTAVIVAPICEEIVFRGYFQRAFEDKSPWVAILIGGFIFSIYHLRFQGMFALLPVAIALGYSAWRTDSIYVSMLMHAAFNSFATLFLILSGVAPLMVTGLIVLSLLVIAFLTLPGTVIGFWLIHKYSKPIQSPSLPVPGQSFMLKRWLWILPLLILMAGYTYVSINEVIMGRFPQVYAENQLEFSPITSPPPDVKITYDVRNILDKPLGKATCIRMATNDTFTVTCDGNVESFDLFNSLDIDLPIAANALHVPEQTWSQESTWSNSLALQKTQINWSSGDIHTSLLAKIPGQLSVTDLDGNQISENEQLSEDSLIMGEFPWRLQQIPLKLGYSAKTHIVIRDSADGSYTEYSALVVVAGGEPVWTSTDRFIAWKVTVRYTDTAGNKQMLAVWYDANNFDIPIKFSNGDVDYVLNTVETLESR